MKKILTLTLTVSLYFMALVPPHTQAQSDKSKGSIRKNEGAISDRYIVVLRDNVDQQLISSVAYNLARQHGSSPEHIYQHAIKGFSVQLPESAARALSLNPLVEYIEEDALVVGAAVQQNAAWGLDRIDQRSLPLSATYSYPNSGGGVNVYVIDSGIRFSHQEFSGRALLGYDFVADGQNGNDCYGHGTHVAAIIGGSTFGVAKAARLYSVRVLDCLNRGSLSRIISAVDWVTANHVKPAVANLSFISTTASDTLDAAVRNSIAAGVTYVVSAGNNNIDAGTRSPARVAEAITVAATDQMDNRATFSNYGSVVDVFAPGADINSAWATDDIATSLRSGTSSAAGFVTGMAARYLGANPNESPAAVARAIVGNATVGKVINAGVGSPNLLLYRPMSKLVFQTELEYIYNTYLINADGSSLTHLTPNQEFNDTGGEWSPDGSKILFQSIRDNNYEIYVMNSAGSNQRNLTNNPAYDLRAAWSPDGTKVAFTSQRDGNDEIYVMNADGSNQRRLTFNTVPDYTPTWSPDSRKIAFYSYRNSTTRSNFHEMYVMNADGSNQTRVSFNSGRDSGPTWSPDSTRMAFVSSRDGVVEIYVMNADGTNQRRLTTNTAYDSSPVWSPDGNRIAFISYRDLSDSGEIYVMNPDGSNQTRLTLNSTDDMAPVWSPDGTRIAFVGKSSYYTVDADGIYTLVSESAVFLMNADGSNCMQITDGSLGAIGASWQPF